MQFYLLAFLAIIVLIVVHEAGHFQVARWCRMKVEKFSIFFGPPIASFKRKGTAFQIGTIPLGGFVQITGMNPMEDHDPNDPYVYPNRPAWQRFATILAGPFTNYLTAVVLAFVVFAAWGTPHLSNQQQVSQVLTGSPAAQATLQPGDLMIAINGEPVTLDHPAAEILDRAGGKPVHVTIEREGSRRDLLVSPNHERDGHYRMGIVLSPIEEFRRDGILSAARESVVFPVVQTVHIVGAFADMARGKQKADVSGPIQITVQLGKQFRRGPRDALLMVGILSIFLGFFNLMPIPALDGGRLTFLLYEILTRRRVNKEVEARVHMIGAVVLFGLMVLVMFKDVRQLFVHGG
jgi:regulator of sigma E protease